ncbi:MAG: hypothetical protein HQL31_04305, partial [Planctomycetes bacterium]|nr:hypothetical protein [Planctomycetota bacterium]
MWFTHTAGGNFNHNNGTSVFKGANPTTIDVNASETFYGFTIYMTNTHTLDLSSGDNITVSGTLTLTDGKVNTGMLNAKGNVDVAATFDGGTTTILADSTGSQNINILGGVVPDFVLNSPASTITMVAGATARFDNSFTLQAGSFTATTGTLTVDTTYAQSGGTFDGGSTTASIGDTFTLSGGTHTASSGTTTFINGFTHTDGGNFNHNNGNAVFRGTNPTTIDIAAVEEFYGVNVYTNYSSHVITISSGDNIIVNGTLTLTDGYINTGILNARGNVDVIPGFDGGTATLIFSGNAQQTYTDNDGSIPTGTPTTVDKGGGSLVLATDMNFSDAGHDLTIIEGTLDLAGYNLAVNNSFTVQAGGNLRMTGDESSVKTPALMVASTVDYYASSGSRSIVDWDYADLKISGVGTFTLGSAETLVGNLFVSAGNFIPAGQTFAVNGNVEVSGGNLYTGDGSFTFGDAAADAVNMSGGNLYVDSAAPDTDVVVNAQSGNKTGGTVHFTDASSTTVFSRLSSYWGLTINSEAATFIGNANVDVNGPFTMVAGTVDMGTNGKSLLISNNVLIQAGNILSSPAGNIVFDGDLSFNDSAGGTDMGNLYIGASPDTTTLASDLVCGNLTVNAGDRLITDGYEIDCANDLLIFGDLDATNGTDGVTAVNVAGDWLVLGGNFLPGSSTLTLDGRAAQQVVTAGSNSFTNLTVTNPSAQVSFADAFSVGNFTCTTPGADMLFVAGGHYTITGTLNISGSSTNLITLDSSDHTTRFTLDVTAGNQIVTNAAVGDCQASTSDLVSDGCRNLGNNDDEEASPHWIFEPTTSYTWTGAINNSWEEQGNWDTGDGTPGNDGYPSSAVNSATIATGVATITTTGDLVVGNVLLDTGFSGTLSLGGHLNVDDILGNSGDFTVNSGTLTHPANDAAETYRLVVNVDGDFTLASGAAVDVNEKGYEGNDGPGKPAPASSDGGAYGGIGGDDGLNGTAAATYGNIYAPGNIGSGCSHGVVSGGGAVLFTVGGASTINGPISADGEAGDGAGSGGSVFLTTGTLNGSGAITALGGNSPGNYGGGGGGRISLVLRSGGADFSSCTGVCSARGGDSGGAGEDGAAGTVYRQSTAQGTNNGELLIDNDNLDTTSLVTTHLSASVTGGEVGDVRIVDGARLNIDQAAVTITVSGNWTNSSYQNLTNGTVVFDSTAAETILSGGDNFFNLNFSGAGGSWTCADALNADGNVSFSSGLLDGNAEAISFGGSLSFSGGGFQTGTGTVAFGDAAGDTVTMSAGNLYINSGDPDGDLALNVGSWINTGGVIHYTGASSTAVFNALSSYWGLGVNSPGNTFTASADVDVNGSFALSAGVIDLAANGRSLLIAGDVILTGGSINCGSTGNVVLDGDLSYTDSSGSFNAGNLFIGGSSKTTTLASDLIADNLTIYAGDRLVTAGYDITVGNITVYGNLEAGSGAGGSSTLQVRGHWLVSGGNFICGDSVVELKGTASQQVHSDGTDNAFHTLVVENSAATVNFTDAFSAVDFTCATPGANLIFQAGSTCTISSTLTLTGSAADNVFLNSSDGATRFTLDVTGGDQVATWAHISNSAVSSNDITAYLSNNTVNNDDGEASPHWIFVGTYVWTGATNNNWSTASNWTGGTAPGSSDTAHFVGVYPVNCTVDQNLDISGMDISPEFAGTITLGAGFTVNVGSGDWFQASGNFIGGDGDIIFKDDFTLSAGNFTASSGNTFFTAPNTTTRLFTISGSGNFIHNSGNIVFDNTGTGGHSIDVVGSVSFNNMTVDKQNGTYDILTIASGDTVEVLGVLMLEDGRLNTGTIAAKGGGNINPDFTGGSGKVIFDGSGSQMVSLNGGTLPHLEINNPFAVFTLAANADATFSGNFTLGGGNIDCTSGGSLTVSGDYTQSGGNFHGGNTTLAFNEDFVISAGNFTSSSSTTFFSPNSSIFRNFTIAEGASFIHNGGTMNFYSPSLGNHNIDVATTVTFNNLIINKASGSYDYFTIASGDTIEVLGDLTLTDGKIYTGAITVKGDLIVGTAFNGGTGSLLFDGSSTQNLLINGGTLPNFAIDNPLANLSLASGATATMSGTFTLSEGNILFDSGGSLTVSGD